METILISFERESGDMEAACDKIRSLFPGANVSRNPRREELEKIRRNGEYLDMIEQSRKEIAEGGGVPFSVDELDLMAEMPIGKAREFAAKRALEKGAKPWR